MNERSLLAGPAQTSRQPKAPVAAGPEQIGRSETDGSPAALFQLMMSGLVVQALAQVARLRIADYLSEGALSVEELARRTSTHELALLRVLRCVASVGVLRQEFPGVFELTPLGQWLRTDRAQSLNAFAQIMGVDWQWRAFGRLDLSLGDGGIAFDRVFGVPVFQYLQQHESEAAVFNDAMTGASATNHRAAVDAVDFSRFRTIADIGGGHGALLAWILAANPAARGILFDQPHVVERAGSSFVETGSSERWTAVGGDFLESVPAGCDAYLLAHIIHDWEEEKAVRILRNVRAAMPGSGRVFVLELVIPEDDSPHPGKMLDLIMMTVTGGRERTAAEYADLFARAGLRLSGIFPTASPVSVLVAEPGE